MNINKKICNYIANNWVKEAKSIRAFADVHNVNEFTVRKILSKDGYKMPIYILERICKERGIKVSEFLQLIDE